MWHPHLKRNWINEKEYIMDQKKNSYPAFLEVVNGEKMFLANEKKKLQCSCRFVKDEDAVGSESKKDNKTENRKGEINRSQNGNDFMSLLQKNLDMNKINMDSKDNAVVDLLKNAKGFRLKENDNFDSRDIRANLVNKDSEKAGESIFMNSIKSINFNKKQNNYSTLSRNFNNKNNSKVNREINLDLEKNDNFKIFDDGSMDMNRNTQSSPNTPNTPDTLNTLNTLNTLKIRNGNLKFSSKPQIIPNKNFNTIKTQNFKPSTPDIQGLMSYLQMNSVIMKNIQNLLLNTQQAQQALVGNNDQPDIQDNENYQYSDPNYANQNYINNIQGIQDTQDNPNTNFPNINYSRYNYPNAPNYYPPILYPRVNTNNPYSMYHSQSSSSSLNDDSISKDSDEDIIKLAEKLLGRKRINNSITNRQMPSPYFDGFNTFR